MAELKQNIEIPQTPNLTAKIFPHRFAALWLQEVVDECSISYGTPSELWATAFWQAYRPQREKVSLKIGITLTTRSYGS